MQFLLLLYRRSSASIGGYYSFKFFFRPPKTADERREGTSLFSGSQSDFRQFLSKVIRVKLVFDVSDSLLFIG